jgi:hypothetical protein
MVNGKGYQISGIRDQEAKRRGTIAQRSQRSEHGGHRDEKSGERVQMKEEKRREFVAFERKSPPLQTKGWGTLKYIGSVK